MYNSSNKRSDKQIGPDKKVLGCKKKVKEIFFNFTIFIQHNNVYVKSFKYFLSFYSLFYLLILYS